MSTPQDIQPEFATIDAEIERLRLQHERDQHALDVLYRVSLVCRGMASDRAIFDVLCRELQAVFALDSCYIALCDLERPDVFRTALLYDEGLVEYVSGTEFGPMTMRMVRERVPILIPDLDELRSTLNQHATTFGNTAKLSRTWMGVPLLLGQDALGVIAIQSYTPNRYTAADHELLQRIGQVVTVALENANLIQHQRDLSDALAARVTARTEELAALSAIAAEMVLQQPLPTLLDRVLARILPLLGAAAGNVRFYDRERDVLVLLAQRGLPADDARAVAEVPVDGSRLGSIVRDNRPLVIERDLVQYALNKGPSIFESLLGIPLQIGDRAIGSMVLLDVAPRTFASQQIDLAQLIGNQVAIAIENARLLDQRDRQIRELDAIGRIGKLVSASFDLEEILEVVYTTLRDVTGAPIFYLLICEPDTHIVTNAMFIEQGQRNDFGWVGGPPRPGSMTDWILQQREPLLHTDLLDYLERTAEPAVRPKRFGNERHARAWAGVPLLAEDGAPIGVLSVQHYEPNLYDARTIDFLGQVASHISLGVQKIRLFQQREQQISENARLFAAEQAARRTADTLREVARVLSSTFDANQVLELILDQLRSVIDYDSASIMLLEGDLLRPAAQRGLDDNLLRQEPLRLNGQNAASLAVKRGQPVTIEDTLTSSDWQIRVTASQIRAWLGVPLLSKGRVLGVLNIDSRRPQAFSERDTEVALAFANQAAVALENAQLYEESVTRVEQELEIARRIQSNLFPRELPHVPGLMFAARAVPARETGGDFYDIVALGEGRFGLLVGDASGKSIPGAMLMAVARSTARSEARDHELPETVMRETNRWIALDVPPRAFVALSYASLDLGRQRMALANAGQLAPLRRRADGSVEYLNVPGPTFPLGIQPEIPYAALEVELLPGDLILFYTDGIVEAHNPRRELFGFERLEALLHEHGGQTPEQLIETVLAAVEAFSQGTPQHDDMTLLALRVA
jgi:phosphoserine phosphatase RsbU/P